MPRARSGPKAPPVEPEAPATPEVGVAPEPEPVEVADPLPEPVAPVEAPEVVPEPPAPTAKWEGLTLVNIRTGTVLGRLSPLAAAFIGGGSFTPIWFAGPAEVMGPPMGSDKAREWLTDKATRAGWVVA